MKYIKKHHSQSCTTHIHYGSSLGYSTVESNSSRKTTSSSYTGLTASPRRYMSMDGRDDPPQETYSNGFCNQKFAPQSTISLGGNLEADRHTGPQSGHLIATKYSPVVRDKVNTIFEPDATLVSYSSEEISHPTSTFSKSAILHRKVPREVDVIDDDRKTQTSGKRRRLTKNRWESCVVSQEVATGPCVGNEDSKHQLEPVDMDTEMSGMNHQDDVSSFTERIAAIQLRLSMPQCPIPVDCDRPQLPALRRSVIDDGLSVCEPLPKEQLAKPHQHTHHMNQSQPTHSKDLRQLAKTLAPTPANRSYSPQDRSFRQKNRIVSDDSEDSMTELPATTKPLKQGLRKISDTAKEGFETERTRDEGYDGDIENNYDRQIYRKHTAGIKFMPA